MLNFLLASVISFGSIWVTLPEVPGEKTGVIIFDTRYLADIGSKLEDNQVHLALVKTATTIPDTTEVLVYARDVNSSSAADWFELLPRLTIADYPHDYALANAKKHNVMVSANYVPETPAETNKLLRISAKIQMRITPTSELPIVIPKATLIKE